MCQATSSGPSTSSSRALVWKGPMAFLLMYAQNNLDVGVWAEELSREFQEKAREFLVPKDDEMVQSMLCGHCLPSVLMVFKTYLRAAGAYILLMRIFSAMGSARS